MTFTPEEQAAVDAHAAALGVTAEEHIRQTAADRAVAWQRTQESLLATARRRGTSAEAVLRRGCLDDGDQL
jgi:hypothetical protein